MRGSLTEPGRDSPYRDRSVVENLDLFRRMREGRISERGAGVACQDRHGAPATSICGTRCSIAFCTRAPADRHKVVHLSDIRLCPRPIGRARGRDTFAVHARVRGPPPALRLAARQSAGAVAAAAVRVRPPQPQLHRAVETLSDRAGAARPGQWLGRPAHADDWRRCGVAACRRKRSATLCVVSAWRGPTASSMSRCSSIRSASF